MCLASALLVAALFLALMTAFMSRKNLDNLESAVRDHIEQTNIKTGRRDWEVFKLHHRLNIAELEIEKLKKGEK